MESVVQAGECIPAKLIFIPMTLNLPVLAISFLTRYESAEFFLLFPAAVLCCAISGRISWKQAALSTFSLFAVSFAVLALFFAVYADGKMINEYRKYYSNKADVIERSVMEKEDSQP